ncbi:hypothetical protein M3629_17470 [Paenibacillus polysaccharolyticus]|uniref:hypothetical protein n=1 Tax=Paenibacillus polysaccharolyticus TaxID=582692 RepID=UPI00203AB034|nr:hypothetical protein [Paenibacillus polysaccharolyticus]MCM3134582.1 hypothetical protein [Paenibacillus polysaccharolyticus]
MQPELTQITDINEADIIELVNGETKDFTAGKMYEVKVDDGSIFGVENERYTIDDTYVANTEMFYSPHLELKYYKKISE